MGTGAAAVNRDLERRREIERWIAWVRVSPFRSPSSRSAS